MGGTSSRRAALARAATGQQVPAIATPVAPDVRLEQNIGLGEVNQVAGFMGISSAADTSAGGERRSARRHRVFDYAAMNAGPAT